MKRDAVECQTRKDVIIESDAFDDGTAIVVNVSLTTFCELFAKEFFVFYIDVFGPTTYGSSPLFYD